MALLGSEVKVADVAVAVNARLALPGQRKVKYFGKELPPKCALRTCWLTDDGQHFYCTDFTCNRHKYRRTKYDRYSKYQHLDPVHRAAAAPATPAVTPAKPGEPVLPTQDSVWPLVPFHCPRCGKNDIQMRLLQNRYECSSCDYAWR